MKKLLRGLAPLVALAALPATALGQTAEPGFALSRFEPSERGSSWFFGDSLELRGHMTGAVGLVADYAYKPLVIYDTAGVEQLVVVRHQLVGHLGGTLLLSDRVRLSANLPVVLFGDGTAGQVELTKLTPPVGGTVGDVRLAADVRLLGQSGDAFTLAAGARVWIPTGEAASWAGDGKFRLAPQLLAAGTRGRVQWSARAAYVWRQRELSFPENSVGSEVSLGGSAGYTFMDGKLLVGPEVFTTTRVAAAEFLKETSSPVELMFGAHYRGKAWRGGLGVAKGLNRGLGEPAFRVVGSIEYAPLEAAPVDSDGDGIADAQDACPTVSGVASADSAKHGCPADSDGDGIPDAQDSCPTVAGVKSDDAAKNGCPADSDGDGIPDAHDACPAVAGVKSEEAAKNGCPPDTDGDGIPDAQDACPSVAGVKSDDAAKNGCPADRDGDGIPDAEDACADEPGVAADDKAFHGCPLTKDVDTDEVPDREDACLKEPGKRNADPKKNGCPVGAVVNGQLVLDQIKFKTASDVILPESNDTLGRVLETLKKLPESNRYRVEGHTDNQGKPAYNKGLSQRRAQAVVRWFVKKGLSEKRFEAQGFGQDKPISTNDTDEGRQANRRVEIHILEGTNQLPAQPAPAK